MGDWIREMLRGRPAWMNALMLFCAWMAFLYVPWDIFLKPVAVDEEVWFGILFHGWTAKLLAFPHWAIYLLGAHGFSRMRSWMHPWASLYVGQIAIGGAVWCVLEVGGARGWVLGVLGLGLIGGLALALWRSHGHFERTAVPLQERYGDWALITGASAGIGAAFARALAREGLSCVLTARREDRLGELARELERDFGVRTRTVVADLSDPDGVAGLLSAVTDLEVALLVNNAGAGYAGRFSLQDSSRLRDLITLNCVSPVILTRGLLPGMLKRGRGAILITGSVAGRQPLPLHGVYSASKAFDLLFGESLWAELRGSGVDVLVLEPGPTETEFQAAAGEIAHAGESSRAVVEVALDALGRQPSVVSGWLNWLRASAVKLLPRPLAPLLAQPVVARYTPPEMR